MEESDYIFFAGDGIFGVTRTLENVADKLYAVGGNCDNSLYPEELVVDVEKVRFLIVHGHRFHDKLDLVYRAKEVGADCVCFGHTHSYSDETYDGVPYQRRKLFTFGHGGRRIRLYRGRREKYFCKFCKNGRFSLTYFFGHYIIAKRCDLCGCSSMVEFQPSKLAAWVRFPSPAPKERNPTLNNAWASSSVG